MTVQRPGATRLLVRSMTHDDIPRACELALEAGWRSRQDFYELVLRVPSCQPLVGTVGGEIVATGVATVSGRAGWVGTIVVGLAWRGRGYGAAMTEAVCERLRGAGCETLLLIATALGQPVYELLGFRIQTHLHLMQGDHVPQRPEPPPGTLLRPLEPSDLAGVATLDASATAEDRTPVLAALASKGGWVLERDGRLAGFWLPSDRGYAPIVAPDAVDGLFLAELHRHLAREGGHARSAIADENSFGWQTLAAGGWRETWLAPRMILGPDIEWRPDWIWGQINFAMG